LSVAELWTQVVRRAVLGTTRERTPLRYEADALGATLDAIDDAGHPEDRLLDVAATLSLYRRAGRMPDPPRSSPTCAPPESRRYVSPRAVALLRELLDDRRNRALLDEWLALVERAGHIAPPSVVVGLLELGRRDLRTRSAVLAVVGERGRWVAQFEPRYRYAARRSDDPESGSDADLSGADESRLEAALDDRSGEVRRNAARLLAALTDSALSQRMRARLDPLLGYEAGAFVVTLPPECDDAMQRDGIVSEPPQGRGRRTWWLEQMVAAVDPRHWCQRFGTSPETLLTHVRAHDHREALVEAWTRASRRHAAADWAWALISAFDDGWRDTSLWRTLPRPRRRDELVQLLYGAPAAQLESRLEVLLDAHPEPFDESLSLVVAKGVRRLLDAPERAIALDHLLDRCGLKLEPRATDAIGRALLEGSRDRTRHELLEELFDTLRFRQAMHDAT
jgi:Family of unknown function (DUF5691)